MLRRFGTEFRPSYVGSISSSDRERFLSKYAEAIPVDGPLETPCRQWPDAIGGDGYGRFGYARKDHLAHRIAWLVWKGEIPVGLYVCHRCDNPWCVNVDHLFLGDQQANMDDMWAKGRGACAVGSQTSRASFTETEVVKILERINEGKADGVIAAEFGVNKQVVQKIAIGWTWQHVPGPRRKPREKQSRFKGVSPFRGRWQAYARANGRMVSLGNKFTSEEEAARARNDWDISQGLPPSNVTPATEAAE